MPETGSEFWAITFAMFITFAGLIAGTLFFARWKNKDLSILCFGLFCFFYGLRALSRIIILKSFLGFPFTLLYFDKIFSYLMTIPFAGYLVLYFGKGIFRSLQLVFITVVLYSAVGFLLDLLRISPPDAYSYHPLVVGIWCTVFVVNGIFFVKTRNLELDILRLITVVLLLTIMLDTLASSGYLPWKTQIEPFGFLLFCIGLAFVGFHHFLTGEQKLVSIEQEIQIARQIQDSNLPSGLTTPPGLSLSAKYVPATTIAGDFYDIHTDENNNLSLLIADVSGHGIGAALIGSMLKVAFASQVKNLKDPALVLTEINTILQDKIGSSFVTACSVHLDMQNRRLIYANAGHPPPVLWKAAEKKFQSCTVHGIALGPLAGATYQNESLKFDTGDRLVLYTDGITETSGKSGAMYGTSNLTALLEATSDQPGNLVTDELVNHLAAWSGKKDRKSFEDDMTLIITDITG